MDSNYKSYNYISSFSRIDDILAQSQSNYEEVNELPDREKLTYSNGYYANCSALFVDIRDSSKLPERYRRPALAKLYRAFISEIVAVLNGNTQSREINIVGDCVWGVFNTPYKAHIDGVFSTAAQANSLVKVLNYKLSKAGYNTPISIGIGMSYGRALMIKAGYNGSGISDVIYMGDVVNHAAKLASRGSEGILVPPMMIGDAFAANLSELNSKLVARDWTRQCYTANAVNISMNDWYDENCT
ncbi:adenylate/guanylate cyclase domain-containing protein [Gordonia sp. SID5947]|uniref:adenylate/guanylate cyclase domain-containing protein n=1 Tax=Gordonia sp. SID5947 TaxID=2690315 RepID=UPI00136916E8|nr:adenylate/guanylate cyclase domain-containing protein [Gordonia sp. SID5947]MYR07768.1 adenylate/guanylate cyclase domain-containing protein [Gordonia sp. SID5947]